MIAKSCFLWLWLAFGVFGVDTDGLKSVSVMEGDSVTLHTDVTEIQRDYLILWMFGPQETRIAEIIKRVNSIDDGDDGRFRDKLQLDDQTGSLIIRNIRIKHSGLYKLMIISIRGTSYKRFSVTVYAGLPGPDITNNCSSSSSSERSSRSKCVLVCSVENVTHVTLSWYKGNSLLSSISVSDLNNSLSLPLEVECQENNIYSCVINNPIRNQTKHLDITEVCQMCSEQTRSYLLPMIVAGVVALVITAVSGVIYWNNRDRDQERHKVQNHEGKIQQQYSVHTVIRKCN
ncbi:hepatocyte cell adhesion molecule-like isoform X3 [Xyrauchen texanus]|uniref:hepatocyte cell adhesion molecule-like isoform X2 n=1 Tax=Xyrauchen texanus TaxID=154827 RepID=UPI002241EED4|nr:hepatocyte cell adhesion molecule-like isoform X2 [Xyrauchen texanus]XP_051977630.1 hepatocyte cell adhesion molecule-like isoform X3 [Xyrauchen texanus]